MKLVGERRALAAVVFAFYFLALPDAGAARRPCRPSSARRSPRSPGVYGLAFFSLVAGYFWARWYAVGVGLYGVITAASGCGRSAPEPVLLFIGGTHLAATVCCGATR